MEKATEIAIEYGWEQKDVHYERNESGKLRKSDVLLDINFWKALGKAEGWGDEFGIDDRTFWNGTIDFPKISDEGKAYRAIWRWQMHNFIDHIAEGEPIDDFFNNLLK